MIKILQKFSRFDQCRTETTTTDTTMGRIIINMPTTIMAMMVIQTTVMAIILMATVTGIILMATVTGIILMGVTDIIGDTTTNKTELL